MTIAQNPEGLAFLFLYLSEDVTESVASLFGAKINSDSKVSEFKFGGSKFTETWWFMNARADVDVWFCLKFLLKDVLIWFLELSLTSDISVIAQ